MKPSRYADCLVPTAIDRPLTYSVPPELSGRVVPGARVMVPLRSGHAVAVVIGVTDRHPEGFEAKAIESVLDDAPFYDEAMMKFLKWVGEYYLAPPGLVLRAAMPAHSRHAPVRRRQQETEEEIEGPVKSAPPVLTRHQAAAAGTIGAAVAADRYKAFLLHGVTGSGKTEVYLDAAARTLAREKSVIALVPEITLSYQIVAWFKARFGDRVLTMHSRLTDSERARALAEARRGPRIVVGARSAIFAPVTNLGLVIVDEEHEGAYKQEESPPFYHARECALMRGKLSACPVVLGSATPALETAARAKAGHLTLLELPERVDGTPLPEVELVRMDREPGGTVIGETMARAIKQTVGRHEQVLLFLNRRGFAPVFLCVSCGAVSRCENCSTTLVFHAEGSSLMCHWCGTSRPYPKICARCSGNILRPLGLGTQRVEHETRRIVPDAKIVRMDQDTTKKRLAHRDLLSAFAEGDVLIGTQMVAKGLDFPRLTLAGVILAELSLTFPDFRAAENTFRLLTQVAGRAGRRDVQGRVLIQTFAPDHPAIKAAAEHDYWGFFETEMAARRALGYPPYGRLIRFRLTGTRPTEVEAAAGRLAKELTSRLPARASVLGPAPAFPAVVAKRHRWHLVLKGPVSADLRDPARRALEAVGKDSGFARVQISADVDPVNVMS
jgi:primosomal protein N' (replication factor Y)